MLCRLLLTALLALGASLVVAEANANAGTSVDPVADKGSTVDPDADPKQSPEPDSAAASISSRALSSPMLNRPKTQVGSGVVTANPVSLVLGLAFVVLLIFLVAWLLRRMGAVSLVSGQAMKVVAALSVGPREKVVLVDIGGKQLLLGVAPGRVSHLHEFDQPVISNEGGVGDFSAKLKQMMQGTNNSDQETATNAKGGQP